MPTAYVEPVVWTASGGQPPKPRDLAPGLTLPDIDGLLRDHYAKGYRDGERAAWADARERIAKEHAQAAQEAEASLFQWMWPNVLNRVLTASERVAGVIDAPKSTIVNDRKHMETVLRLLKDSLHAYHSKRPGDGKR